MKTTKKVLQTKSSSQKSYNYKTINQTNNIDESNTLFIISRKGEGHRLRGTRASSSEMYRSVITEAYTKKKRKEPTTYFVVAHKSFQHFPIEFTNPTAMHKEYGERPATTTMNTSFFQLQAKNLKIKIKFF